MSGFVTFTSGKKILKEFSKNGEDGLIGREVKLAGQYEVDFSDFPREFGRIVSVDDDGKIVIVSIRASS